MGDTPTPTTERQHQEPAHHLRRPTSPGDGRDASVVEVAADLAERPAGEDLPRGLGHDLRLGRHHGDTVVGVPVGASAPTADLAGRGQLPMLGLVPLGLLLGLVASRRADGPRTEPSRWRRQVVSAGRDRGHVDAGRLQEVDEVLEVPGVTGEPIGVPRQEHVDLAGLHGLDEGLEPRATLPPVGRDVVVDEHRLADGENRQGGKAFTTIGDNCSHSGTQAVRHSMMSERASDVGDRFA